MARLRICALTQLPMNVSRISRTALTDMSYRQVPDSLDFQLVRAKLRAFTWKSQAMR